MSGVFSGRRVRGYPNFCVGWAEKIRELRVKSFRVGTVQKSCPEFLFSCATNLRPPVVEFSMTGGVFMKKGTPHFLYTNKDSPDYVAPFAPFYSDRQKAILSGELSVEEVELRELGRLRNKARNMGDEENLEIANILYEEKSNPSAGLYKHYTAEEAAEILRRLTPPGFES